MRDCLPPSIFLCLSLSKEITDFGKVSEAQNYVQLQQFVFIRLDESCFSLSDSISYK